MCMFQKSRKLIVDDLITYKMIITTVGLHEISIFIVTSWVLLP